LMAQALCLATLLYMYDSSNIPLPEGLVR
jgi:hypothetical protein